MKRFLFALLVMLGCSTTATAQITIPNTFTPITVAQSALVNANFAQVGNLALNRSGGNITGNITASPGVLIDGVDVGVLLGGSGTPTFASITVTGVSGLTTVVVSDTSASALDVAGGIQAGSGNVNIIGTDGRIPAISTTFFASLSGANLTGIPETAITNGALLARLADPETITATWTFAAFPVSAAGFPAYELRETDVAVDNQRWIIGVNAGAWSIAAYSDSGGIATNAVTIARSGTTITNITSVANNVTLTGATTGINFNALAGSIVMSGSIVNTPLAVVLGAGLTNNFNGAQQSSAMMITANGGGSTLSGLIAEANGSTKFICSAAQVTTLTHEDANSTAANRFNNQGAASISLSTVQTPCVTAVYSTTRARWLVH